MTNQTLANDLHELAEECPSCGQSDEGQTGEYSCATCGLPTVHDDAVSERAAGLAHDLRQAADVIESMVGSEFAGTDSAVVYVHTTTADEFKTLIRLLGGTRSKHESESYFWVSRLLGKVKIVIMAPSREAICTRRVTGTRVVPELIERATGRMIEEEIVKWDCPDSILSTIEA